VELYGIQRRCHQPRICAGCCPDCKENQNCPLPSQAAAANHSLDLLLELCPLASLDWDELRSLSVCDRCHKLTFVYRSFSDAEVGITEEARGKRNTPPGASGPLCRARNQNAALRVGLMVRQETQRGQVMDLIQAFLLGIMVAWTPSLIVLAVLLRDIR
jgi:hypothetical protein